MKNLTNLLFGCRFPNPEEGKTSLDLSIKTAEANNSTIILANDPDADRFAVAEKNTKYYLFLDLFRFSILIYLLVLGLANGKSLQEMNWELCLVGGCSDGLRINTQIGL